jgi:GDPmannose 4,6-dehydratase
MPTGSPSIIVSPTVCTPVNGILFNHESPIRGETFVTRKVTRALARIKPGLQRKLYLGNLDSQRDWGHARDDVQMQWLMLQQERAQNYVIATGVQHSVRDFVTMAAACLAIHLQWTGAALDEQAYDQHGNVVVALDRRYFWPAEVETLLGDASRARNELGWSPRTDFRSLVEEMALEDLRTAQLDAMIIQNGFEAYSVYDS